MPPRTSQCKPTKYLYRDIKLLINEIRFAHYMIGQINPSETQTDIDNAATLGIDGFALNFGKTILLCSLPVIIIFLTISQTSFRIGP